MDICNVFEAWLVLLVLYCRVYPYLCRAVRNFARDRGGVNVTKEFYVAFEDVSTRHK